jgi:transcriptional regulator with XRE-family HTH domain
MKILQKMKINFRRLREDGGWTLGQLAEKSGYSAAAINGLERHGRGSPRLQARLLELLAPETRRGGDIIRAAFERKNRSDAAAQLRELEREIAALQKIHARLLEVHNRGSVLPRPRPRAR